MKKLAAAALSLLVFALPFGASATTYATWNPSDKSTHLTLSGSNLIVTSDGNAAGQMVRSTIGKSSGKWYWEYKTFSTATLLGIADGSASVDADTGLSATSWASYSDNGATKLKFNNSVSSAYGNAYGGTDTIGVALDMDAGTITIYINNVSQGTMYSGLTGTIYASVGQDSSTWTTTANFGASAQTYSPPAGFCAGLVDVCPSGAAAAPDDGWSTYE